MYQPSTDQIIAHADFLRAVDRFLRDVEELRIKREAISRLVREQTEPRPRQQRKAPAHA
jgi:hypothetical protein